MAASRPERPSQQLSRSYRMFVRNPSAPPINPQIVEALSQVCTSTLGHLRDYGFPRGLTPNVRPLKFVGTAVTVRLPHLDSTAVHVAADDLRPGDVLVVEQSGDEHRSCFGGLVSFTAKARGAVGAVIDGQINDIEEMSGYGFPAYSRGVAAHTTRIAGIEGAINVPVSIGGVVIKPGDVVFADSDGVAILDRGEALEIADLLKQKEDAEIPAREAILAGSRISDFSGAAKFFA
ncbi:RraA family protein [Micromonospora sp. NPDC050200]|uniref:RraA family protein n=1 Tax=Micromonospora sp. NPDC050200 TaxID=3155664 RepID=UPI003409EBF7